MKTRITTILIVAITIVLINTGIVVAHESEPPENRQTIPFPAKVLEANLHSKEPFLGQSTSSFNRSTVPAFEFGKPGLKLTYVETFGVTEEPYLADFDHFNDPTSVTIDDANIWVSEWNGMRVVKFDADGNYMMTVGTAGVNNDDEDLGNAADTAIDKDGNIWVSDGDSHRVLKFNSAGEYQKEMGYRGDSGDDNEHFNRPHGLAIDSKGNLFVSDRYNHRIQIFKPDGTYLATLGVTGESGSDNAHFDNPFHIHIDANGILYVTDIWNHRVQIFDAGVPTGITYVTTIGVSGESGSDNAHFNAPFGIAADASKIFVTDFYNNRVQIFSADTYDYLATLGTGSQGPGNYEFHWINNVEVDVNGNIYVSDSGNHRVQKFNSNYVYVSTLGTIGVPYVTDSEHYNAPFGLAVDDMGNTYFAEEYGNRLIKLDSQGELQWAIGEPGIAGNGNEQFSRPRGIALDNHGQLYVAEHDNHRVQILDSAGNYINTFGSGYGDGDYQFSSPSGVAVAPDDKIYVADTWNHRVQVYSENRIYLTTLGETDVIGTDNSHFHAPHGIAVDDDGNIYVADSYNQRVQIYDQNHNFRFTIGITGVEGDDPDQFRGPSDIAIDEAGDIYVADTFNNRIQVFDNIGAYRATIGGDWGSDPDQLRGVPGVAVDNAGNIYITDEYNHRIQKYAPLGFDWVQANHDGFGDEHNRIVTSLASFDDSLYAGTYNDRGNGSQLWRMDTQTNWMKINADGFGNTANEAIDDMIEFKGHLYAGTWANDTNGGEVWRSDNGIDWEQVVFAGFGDPTNAEVFKLYEFNGDLYASTWSDSHGTEIWRSTSGDAGSWDRVVVNGFGDPENSIAVSFTEFDGYLYVGTDNQSGAEVWRSQNGDSESWERVAASGIDDDYNWSVTLEPFGEHLYAGTYNYASSDDPGSELWRCQLCDGTDWQKITSVKGFGDTENRAIRSLIAFDEMLYAITYNRTTGMEVWRSNNGENWSQTGIDGFGDSENYSPYWGNSVAIFDDNLFVGTSNRANGGEVWKYLHQKLYMPILLH